MEDGNIEKGPESRPEWEHLEEWLRGQMQGLIQDLLEQEVTEFLGRARSIRRSESDNDAGYRNGYAPSRRLTLSSGTIRVRRPRVRDTEERFESRLLPLFVHRTREVADLIPELYLHGLSEGDFDLALRGLLGEEAPISASTVARLKDKWNAELAEWRARPLDDLEVVYMWVDGVGRPAWSGTGCESSRRHRRRRPSSREWESSPPLVSPRSGPAGWRAGGW